MLLQGLGMQFTPTDKNMTLKKKKTTQCSVEPCTVVTLLLKVE